MIHLLFLLVTLFCLTSCASQRAPSGGPPDKTPPKIIKVTPEKNAALVPLDQIVEFEFSESMNRKSLEKAIFITPNPGDRVRFKWKRRRLRIEFLDSLKTDRTYVITMGTDLRDLHGNSLNSSFTLAFSTGAEISNGKISGQVFSTGGVQGILIWAYILEEGREPDPANMLADYVTQTDAQGKFELTNLSQGDYRIFAIDDVDHNRFFEVGLDGLGMAAQDMDLTKDKLAVSNLSLRVVVQDTVGPALVSASAPDRVHVNLRFDERLHEKGIEENENYLIRPLAPSTGDSLAIELAYLDAQNPQEVWLITEPQVPQTEYEIKVSNVVDQASNAIAAGFSRAQFIASALPDTIRPKIVTHSPEDSARTVSLKAAIELYFSEAMEQRSLENHFQLVDSLGQTVSGTFKWESLASVKFSPNRNLASRSVYLVKVRSDSVRDLFGNTLAAPALTFMFTTLNKDTLSSISGMLTDQDSTAKGRIYLRAIQTSNEKVAYDIQLDEPGPYKFEDILPGNYRIEGFRDRDNNGQYSYGQPLPFQPAERFFVYSDEIKVRARWPNEGNDLTFPE